MSDQMVDATSRVTAAFTVKLPNPDGIQYAHYEATVFVPLGLPENFDADDAEATANQALAIAKRATAEQLGIESETEVTEAGLERVTLLLEKKMGATPVKEAPKSNSGGGNRSNGNRNKPKRSGGGGGAGGRKGPSKTRVGSVVVLNALEDPLPDWLSDTFDRLVESGDVDPEDNEVWDNRKFSPDFGGNGSGNAPWFKTTQGEVVLDWGGDPVEPK